MICQTLVCFSSMKITSADPMHIQITWTEKEQTHGEDVFPLCSLVFPVCSKHRRHSKLSKHTITCPLQMYKLHTNYRPEKFLLRNQVVIYISTQAMFMQQDVCSRRYLQVPLEIQDLECQYACRSA
jgi:hypothetical protein